MSLIVICNHENKEIDIVTWFFKNQMKQEECTIEEVVASCLHQDSLQSVAYVLGL